MRRRSAKRVGKMTLDTLTAVQLAEGLSPQTWMYYRGEDRRRQIRLAQMYLDAIRRLVHDTEDLARLLEAARGVIDAYVPEAWQTLSASAILALAVMKLDSAVTACAPGAHTEGRE